MVLKVKSKWAQWYMADRLNWGLTIKIDALKTPRSF